jgi:hypothetical protein
MRPYSAGVRKGPRLSAYVRTSARMHLAALKAEVYLSAVAAQHCRYLRRSWSKYVSAHVRPPSTKRVPKYAVTSVRTYASTCTGEYVLSGVPH